MIIKCNYLTYNIIIIYDTLRKIYLQCRYRIPGGHLALLEPTLARLAELVDHSVVNRRYSDEPSSVSQFVAKEHVCRGRFLKVASAGINNNKYYKYKPI
jgi:hypothetical protein